jgi:hypothetical protein
VRELSFGLRDALFTVASSFVLLAGCLLFMPAKRHDPRQHDCPTCGAKAFDYCRTPKGRPVDYHKGR